MLLAIKQKSVLQNYILYSAEVSSRGLQYWPLSCPCGFPAGGMVSVRAAAPASASRGGCWGQLPVLGLAQHRSHSPDDTRLGVDVLVTQQQPVCPIPVSRHCVQQTTVFVSAVFSTERQRVSEPSWLPVLPANGNQMASCGRFRGLI